MKTILPRYERILGLLRVPVAVAVFAAVGLASLPAPTHAAGEDWAIDGGWFFTQTRGQEADSSGFAVLDTANIPFWTEFKRQGGVEALGLPVSHRFTWDGSVTQAFQRGVLQWRPDAGVQIAPTFDTLSKAGLDDWLMATYAIPRIDDGKVASRSLLAENADIAQAYSALPNAGQILGAPVAIEDFGAVQTLRTEKSALQYWKVETNFAPVGGVTIPNTGDVLAAAGIIPTDAAKAQQVGYVGGFGGYYPYGGVASPVPQYYYPYYPYYHPPVVQSAPYYPYYPYGYNWSSYYGYGGWGYSGYSGYAYRPYGYSPMVYPYAPYAQYAPYRYPSYPYYPYSYAPYGYGYGYGNYGYYGSLPQHSVCQGDEQMSFNPGHPGTNQQFTIEVTSARPHAPATLRGPGNPVFAGVRGGGKGYIWSWRATIGSSGRYNFDFVVYSGTVCTANVMNVG